jgi:branched-chain amino acid transport system substrate-binding protein
MNSEMMRVSQIWLVSHSEMERKRYWGSRNQLQINVKNCGPKNAQLTPMKSSFTLKLKSSVLLVSILAAIGALCQGADERTFRVGVDLPLTGSKSYYGISAREGIEIAKNQLKSEEFFKEREIGVIYEDNQAQAKLAVEAMSKLVNADKVPAIIGGGTSTETMACAPLSTQTKTVLISPISSATSISSAGDYVFRTCPSDGLQAKSLATWVADKGHSSVAIIFASSTWGTGIKNEFVKYYNKTGGKILSIQSSDPNDTDFRSQLTAIKGTNPKALVFLTYAKEGAVAVIQAKELEMQQPIFGADPWSQNDFRASSGKAAEGVCYTSPVNFDGPSFVAFQKDFQTQYHHQPDVYAANGYDCMMLLAKAYQGGARSGEQFQAFLSRVVGHMGATGITTFDENGDVVGKEFGRFTITNGEAMQMK